MRSRHRRPSRTRLLVLATCTMAVLGAGAAGIASAQTIRPHRPSPTLGAATQATTNAAARRPHRPRPHRPPTAPPSSAPVPPPADDPSTPAGNTTPPADDPTTPPSDPATPPSSAPATPPADDTVVAQALAHINAARTAGGRSTLTLDPELTNAAEAHNALMVGGCGLFHQCPGEAGLGDRFTAAGVSWQSAGENIGQGNAANNQTAIVAAANGLTDLMLAEQPPEDGHRRNLLNPRLPAGRPGRHPRLGRPRLAHSGLRQLTGHCGHRGRRGLPSAGKTVFDGQESA